MSMSNPFAAPAASTGITWADHLGKLMLIEPTAIESDIPTSLGDKDAVRATVSVITGPGEAEVFEDCLIFPRVLQSQLRSRLGMKVLGRLTQGVAKPGQSPPWMLQEATTDDVAKGQAYLAARDVAQPAPAEQTPSQWPQPGQQAQPATAGQGVPF
jgi:hypothetical protein